MEQNSFNAANNPDFKVLQVQEELLKLDVRRYKMERLPSLGAFYQMSSKAFDIKYDNSVALLALNNNLHVLDLNSGKATNIGMLQQQIIDLAIPTEPVAYAVDNSNNLQIFNPNSPMPVSKAITGLQSGENILGIDFRPLNGQLYALGSTSRVYTINASSGAAVAVGTAPISPLLSGTSFGFDFNPTVDRIRIVSNTGQKLRFNPADGVAITAGALTTTGQISGAAYTNNFAGSTTTVLFDIDSTNDLLVRQDPPNSGGIVDVGALGVNVEAANGFDIGSTSNMAYGIFTVAGTQRLYSVNLTTGAATAGATITTAARGFTLGLGF